MATLEAEIERLGAKVRETHAALRAMADAYARKVKTGLTPDEIAKEPWRCAEYVEAERVLKVKLLFDNEWIKRAIEREIEADSGSIEP